MITARLKVRHFAIWSPSFTFFSIWPAAWITWAVHSRCTLEEEELGSFTGWDGAKQVRKFRNECKYMQKTWSFLNQEHWQFCLNFGEGGCVTNLRLALSWGFQRGTVSTLQTFIPRVDSKSASSSGFPTNRIKPQQSPLPTRAPFQSSGVRFPGPQHLSAFPKGGGGREQ